jgi:hypothetical protein
LSEHGAEHATHDRKLSAIVDHRLLGCPEKIFFRVCADRAAKLGRKFQEFRASNKSAAVTTGETIPLDLQVEASRLF